MEETKKEIECPKCGGKMNHHADKIISEISEDNLKYYDEVLDGILEAQYKCPDCGAALSKLEKE